MNLQINSFEQFQTESLQRIQNLLTDCLNLTEGSARLNEAMQYSVLNGGKRLRPLLVYATGLGLGANLESLDPTAIAVELIHCYSLIHDDLPAMDNDDLRRGKPTCHKAFDEATAILAGDALQALAFEQLSKTNIHLKPELQLTMILSLAQACGAKGMAAGQALDIAAENLQINLEEIKKIHQHKTGALIETSIELGALAANATKEQRELLKQFGQQLGLAFQIQDDILDVEASTETLGKQQGADQKLGKSTYPQIMGLDQAKLMLKDHYFRAQAILKQLDLEDDYLPKLAEQLVIRAY